MKIIITGPSSYLGNQIKEALSDSYEVDLLSLRRDGWKSRSFLGVKVIIHCAGIAHLDEDIDASIYDRVNHLLTQELALKAKSENVAHFIFLSSILVYGDESYQALTLNSPLSPRSAYAKSKMDAENALNLLKSDSFKVSILRLPMVYGKDSIGNFKRLLKLAKRFPIFPKYHNHRSFLSATNLQRAIQTLIKSPENRVYLMADQPELSTSLFYLLIRKSLGKKTFLVPFKWMINPFKKIVGPLNKVFGSLYYDPAVIYKDYEIMSTEESLNKIQGKSS